MRALIIEASTEQGVVGIVNIEGHLFEKVLPYGFQQSKHLMTSIDEVFKTTVMEPKNLDCIALGVGPGSYTGMRLAAAIAKSIAYACQLPIVGFSSLQAFIPSVEGPFAALFDAKMGGAYVIKGIRKGQEILYTSSAEAHPIEQLGRVLEGVEYLVTPHRDKMEARMVEAYPDVIWQWKEAAPDLKHIVKMVGDKYKKQQWTTDASVELLYLRTNDYAKSQK